MARICNKIQIQATSIGIEPQIFIALFGGLKVRKHEKLSLEIVLFVVSRFRGIIQYTKISKYGYGSTAPGRRNLGPSGKVAWRLDRSQKAITILAELKNIPVQALKLKFLETSQCFSPRSKHFYCHRANFS